MRLENAVAVDVLERILSAYGFTMQKELSDKLGIAKSNVASWLQRGQVPGNVLVQCALDTGADVKWLVTGIFANANIPVTNQSGKHSSLNGQTLLKKMLQSGGKPALQRILEAYGFKTQKELSEYLGISTGTISTWVRRDFFPGDVVITCALDTNISLEWLATGEGSKATFNRINSPIPVWYLSGGLMQEEGAWDADISFIPYSFNKPMLIRSSFGFWLADSGVLALSNGRWILSIENNYDVYDVLLMPGGKMSIINKGSSFICKINEVAIVGRVILTMDSNF